MAYDPISYWTEQGKTYYKDFVYTPQFAAQETALLGYLENLHFESVLELGCGFGRISRLIKRNFPNITKYCAIDISQDQLKIAKEICPSGITFWCNDVLNYHAKQQYDLVIAVELLMHIKPENIKVMVDKMIDWSKHHIVSVDYYEEKPIELQPHNFCHDYFTLYDYNLTHVQVGNQAIFHKERLLLPTD